MSSSVHLSFFLVFAVSLTSALPNNYRGGRNYTVKPSECNYCSYYQSTGNSPYQLLSVISRYLGNEVNSTTKDDLLMDKEELAHAEKLFSAFCDRHCGVSRRSLWDVGNSSTAAASADTSGVQEQTPAPEIRSQVPVNGSEGVSGAVVSGFDAAEVGGSGTAALSGSGATLTGGGLGDSGTVQGSVSPDANGDMVFTGGIMQGGYLGGAMSQGGSASGSSNVNDVGYGTIGASVSGGGTAFGMSGGLNSSANGDFRQNMEKGLVSASVYSKDGSGAGGVSAVGAGTSGSSSLSTNDGGKQGVSLVGKDNNSTITGVSALGEASVSASGSLQNVVGSVATSGGKGSVASLTGQVAASNMFTDTGLLNSFSSKGGFGGGAIISGEAAGSSVASQSAIASSVSGNSGMGTGSSITGNGTASGIIENENVISSVSTKDGMVSSVAAKGKGVAGGSGSVNSGVSMGVANAHGSASGSATGKGASVATSTGLKASLILLSSKEKGAVATAIGSRSLPSEESRKVKILRKHCDEIFCKRFPYEVCCASEA